MTGRGIGLAIASIAIVVVSFMRCESALAAADADRLHFDKQCITIDGHDLVIFSGSFHYFRCPPQLWTERFRKLKEAGFNAVETYAAWNYAEPSPPTGPDDFSKMDVSDLKDWLAMATNQFGLYVILRPGPYICAEWDGGGYPQWLITKRPSDFHGRQWLRSDDPTYLAWCKHWYTAVARVAVPYQISHRPIGKAGIILWQIENEYDYCDLPARIKQGQLDFLAHTSRDLGIDVPLITCMTDNPAFQKDPYLNRNVIETRNTYPKYSMGAMLRDIGMLDRYQPGKFKMITELQGGWFSQVGGELSEAQGFDASHINHITLFAWEHGFTVTNYYMGVGGTNFGDWGADGITTTYDYDAPVRECGGVTERYFAVKALGQFIAEHGPSLARSSAEKFTLLHKDDADVHIALRKSPDGSRYVFVRTEQRRDSRHGTFVLRTAAPDALEISGQYDLGPFGSKVLYLPPGMTTAGTGQWYPKPVDPPRRPTELPDSVVITEARMKVDPGPSDWKALQAGQSEEDAGIYNRGFVYYRAMVPALPSSAGQRFALWFDTHGRDWAGFELNGKRLDRDSNTGLCELGQTSSGGQLVGLYENFGRPNFGSAIGRPCGLFNLGIVPSSGFTRELTQWRMKRVHGEPNPQEISSATDDSDWSTVRADRTSGELGPGESAIYRTSIDVRANDLKTGKSIYFGRVDDDGSLYVNGHAAGECHDWSEPQRLDIGQWLHPGKNLIVLFVHNQDGPGGLSRGARLEDKALGIPLHWQISDRPAGVANQWWKPDLNDHSWQQVRIDPNAAPSNPAAPLLTWYRMRFSLPQPSTHVWVAWKLHLDAAGNGFLYLNGHALGRWWQIGPQRDFYLPECWLNFGAANDNSLALCLRPTEGVGVRRAEIQVYANMAEER
jgi:Glycosyl hydrolases family 35/Beta-galactosidase, galactose-binding domain